MNDIKRVLVVDDEEDLCEILRFNIEKAGFEVSTANSAEEALTLDIESFDLFLLDIMMGDLSGTKLASILKSNLRTAHIPIIFCTAKSTENDTLTGFNLGADDYITKPFSTREVIARINAVLKRSHKPTMDAKSPNAISFDKLFIDLTNKKVKINNQFINLTKTEFELLVLFIQNPNIVFSREELLNRIWPQMVMVIDRTIDVHITRLRKKIAPYGKLIITRFGYGYCFEP